VLDENPMPKGIPSNPYLGMKSPAPPQRDPEIENRILAGILARHVEREKSEALGEERRKRAFVVVALALILLLFAYGDRLRNLADEIRSRGVTCGLFVVSFFVLLAAIEGWHRRREKRKTRR
jgi:hypothetical protein